MSGLLALSNNRMQWSTWFGSLGSCRRHRAMPCWSGWEARESRVWPDWLRSLRDTKPSRSPWPGLIKPNQTLHITLTRSNKTQPNLAYHPDQIRSNPTKPARSPWLGIIKPNQTFLITLIRSDVTQPNLLEYYDQDWSYTTKPSKSSWLGLIKPNQMSQISTPNEGMV